MKKAIDVSNFWLPGPVSDDEALRLMQEAKRQGYSRVIAGTQIPSVCFQQLQAAYRAGQEIQAYLQLNPTQDLHTQVLEADRAVDTLPISRLWVTVEWRGPEYLLAVLTSALADCRRTSFPYLGIYTNMSNWARHMSDTAIFRSYPLWWAGYGNSALDAHEWRGAGFGGWWRPSMKQWLQNVDVVGMNCDQNVY